MKFTEHRDSNINVVKHYEPGLVKINADEYRQSLFLNQHQTYPDWPVEHIDQLTTALLDEILQTQPEVIILGTGEQQIFPHPSLFAHCAGKGVGLEVMANDAACRTFNVITTEDRDVALALIFKNKD